MRCLVSDPVIKSQRGGSHSFTRVCVCVCLSCDSHSFIMVIFNKKSSCLLLNCFDTWYRTLVGPQCQIQQHCRSNHSELGVATEDDRGRTNGPGVLGPGRGDPGFGIPNLCYGWVYSGPYMLCIGLGAGGAFRGLCPGPGKTFLRPFGISPGNPRDPRAEPQDMRLFKPLPSAPRQPAKPTSVHTVEHDLKVFIIHVMAKRCREGLSVSDECTLQMYNSISIDSIQSFILSS